MSSSMNRPFPCLHLGLAGAFLLMAAASTGCLKSLSPSQPPAPTPPATASSTARSPAPAAPNPDPESASPSPASPASPPAPSQPASAQPPSSAGQDQVVSVFQGKHVYFKGDADNQRSIRQSVDFPATLQLFRQITLKLSLRCPDPACDAWDRLGSLSLTLADGRKLELARFITPYGVGVQWSIDVTELAPALVGRREVEVFIDTWVGPGHSQGAGWLVDAAFEFKGGRPSAVPLAVVPVFDAQAVDYGDPAKPAGRRQSVTLPQGSFGQAKLRAFISGHGQGNTENCAEFCPKIHTLQVDAQKYTRRIWRDDCSRTQTDGFQAGTWTTSRAGWCPGATVLPWEQAVTPDSAKLEIAYEPEAYVNDRRSGYNDGGHTPPYWQFSAALVLFAPAQVPTE